MVCPRHRLFLCHYRQLVLKGMVQFCGSLDRKAFSRHEGMECCLFGSHSLAGFSLAESRGIALVKLYAQASIPLAHLPIPSLVA